jgi:hypothetical protein
MHRQPRLLRSLRGKRLAAVVAISAAVVAGIAIGAMASLEGSAAINPALARATSLDAVVAQVRHNFGDRQIVSASREGSVLSVKLDFPGNLKTPGFGVKGVFEAQILGAAVAEWMRARGQEPITTVRYRNRGKVIPGWSATGDPVESDPHAPPLPADACHTAAKSAEAASLTLVSARTLPYLNGTCVFTFKAADLRVASGAAMGAVARIIPAIGGPQNERPWLFELDQKGVAKSGASWMPAGGGVTWTSPGLAYPLAHG